MVAFISYMQSCDDKRIMQKDTKAKSHTSISAILNWLKWLKSNVSLWNGFNCDINGSSESVKNVNVIGISFFFIST